MGREEEIQLVKALKDPERREKAFSELMSVYQERLYWHCRKILTHHDDADDALQNTFIKVWRNIDKFREDSGLFTWLFRIATNEALTLLKANKKHALNDEGENAISLAETLRSDPYFDGDEAEIKLQEAVAALPEKQRLVFNMKYYDEMKYEEISQVLKTSVGALKASYHHAVKKIESFINNE